MNNDLISRSELKKAFEEVYPLATNEMGGVANKKIYEIIDNAPTVDCIEFNRAKELIKQAHQKGKDIRPQGEWGKWIVVEIQCPNCFECFVSDCYSTGELNKCPNCGAEMR